MASSMLLSRNILSSIQFTLITLPHQHTSASIYHRNSFLSPECPFPITRSQVTLPDALVASDFADTDSDSDSSVKKSRNEKKREARRAVRWAMDLAAFAPPQIKRILRDVGEGKRRQFNYIGRLLLEVQPELMDGLIQASKDGDYSKFQAIYGSETGFIDDDAEETEETESDDEVEELCRLVRKVYSLQESEVASEENAEEDKALMAAKRSLTHFLQAIAKQLPIE